jgi:saccharopine dehydrogenase-like NADP-dependent oxidoreductase
MMKNILLIGAGKIGAMIAHMLSTCGDYHVTIGDTSKEALVKMPENKAVRTLQIDVTQPVQLAQALEGKFAVLSAAPFSVTKFIAQEAVKTGVHYFDLTEDVSTTKFVQSLAKESKSALMPQCGLAPGFISIVSYHLAQQFDWVESIEMRVGALAQYPTNGLKYNLTWSTAGLINEYIQPCEAIVNGELRIVDALGGLEKFSLDGVNYEAFNTSGGLGTLCYTMAGQVKHLNYKTVRYPGHCEALKLLIHDLKLGERPELLQDIFETSLPMTYQDVVFIFATVTGKMGQKLIEETYARKIYAREMDETRWSAIQITTAAGVCAVMDLMAEEKLPQQGFVRQEDVRFEDFITNRFGRYYDETAQKALGACHYDE